MTSEFTPSQSSVLSQIEINRLTIVRAGPGAGKTRVFVEALRRKLAGWPSSRAGIAALSFTNVAHEVISERLAGTPGPPHFVGTLDAFLWRFVVRPFGHLAGVTREGPTLIPAPLDEMLSGPTKKFGPEDWHIGSIFKVAFTGGTETAPQLFQGEGRIALVAPYSGWNLEAKRKEWGSRGRVTHSDSQYLASCILRGEHGARVVYIISRRFPVVLVDEFQDTGWFLSRSLLAILSSERIRGAVVGDPDQAIYQFGGAYRSLFDDAEKVAGGSGCVLDESHRCRPKIAAVATTLSRSGKRVVAKNSSPEGRAILLVHNQPVPALDPILANASDVLDPTRGTVLCRKGATVKQLAGVSEGACPWKSGVGRRLHRAVGHLLDHEPAAAARLVRRELAELLLDDESATPYTILNAGISLSNWRTLCHTILMETASGTGVETWNAWLARVKRRVGEEATRLGRPVEGKTLGARFKKASHGGDSIRGPLVSPALATTSVITVHQAKGCEYDAVLFYVPKPHAGHAPCPSQEWWSADPKSEEREVAFVACSRAREALVVAVHKQTYEALKVKRPSFLSQFELRELGAPPAATRAGERSRGRTRSKPGGE